MDDEVFDKAKDENLTKDEAEELQEIVDDAGLDIEDAYEVWDNM